MPQSNTKAYFAQQIVNRLIEAAETCDPEAINDFFALAIDANIEHLNIIDGTLSIHDTVRRQKAISNGATLLALFNHFALQQRLGEIGVLEA